MGKLLKIEKELKDVMCLDGDAFRDLQEKRFIEYIHDIYGKSELYREELRNNNIYTREDLPKSLLEINKLPIIGRKFLLEWTASGETLVDDLEHSIHTSGTTDNPIKTDYSKKSVEIGWGLLGVRALLLMGINLEEKGIMLTSYDEKTKKSHSSHVNTLALKEILQDNLIDQVITRPLNESLNKFVYEKVKWIGTVPIFYNSSIEKAKQMNIDLKNLGIKKLFYGGVDFPEDKRKIVEEEYGVKVLGFYPSTELCSAGSQVDLNNDFFNIKDGQYVLFSDYIIFEFLDKDDNPVKVGETGRVIATPLFMDAMPLVRYDIGDEVVFHGYKNNFPVVSNIRRANAISFSNGNFYFHEVGDISQETSRETGIEISAFQVAKISGEKDVEQPILRVETRERINQNQKKELEKTIIEKFRGNKHIEMMINRGIHGGIHYPIVEFYNYKKLVPEGALKVKLTSDETDMWSSYSFLQSKVTEHMSLIRKLADYCVYGLRGCKNVVDMACGAGYFSSRFAEAGIQVDGVDLNLQMIHYAKKRIDDLGLHNLVDFHNKKAEDTELVSSSYDGVHVSNILCHIPNPDDVLREAKRILRHGGKMTLGEPVRDFKEEAIKELVEASRQDVLDHPEIASLYDAFVAHNHRMTKDMKQTFNLSEMEDKLKNIGFEILDTKPTYAGNAYYILAELFKRAHFRNNILAMEEFSAPLEGRMYDNSLLLNFNERTNSVGEMILEKVKDFIDSGKTNIYSNVIGLDKKIANYCGVREKNILITNGSFQGIDIIFRSVLSEGDKVIIPSPAFDVFKQCADIQSATVCYLNYNNNGSFPVDEIIDSIDENTRLVVLCSPNNPTGTSILKEDVERILSVNKKVTVLVDEAYFEFCGISTCDLINRYSNLFVTRTFSKAFGLASFRVGYVVSNEDNIHELVKIRSPFDVNVLGQVAADSALDNIPYMKRYVDEVMYKSKPLLEYFFIKNNINFYPSSANFIFIKLDNAREFYEKLKEKGILVSVKYWEGVGEGLRISVGRVDDTVVFVKAFEEILDKERGVDIEVFSNVKNVVLNEEMKMGDGEMLDIKAE